MYTLAGDRAKVALEFALAVLILSTVLVAVIPFYGLAIFPLVGELLCTLNLLSLILVSLRLVTFPWHRLSIPHDNPFPDKSMMLTA